jgi:hypothetical protein
MQNTKVTTLGHEQYFQDIYEREFRDVCPTLIDFYEQHVFFLTLTLHPHKVSLIDRSGISRNRCFYQDIIDGRDRDWLHHQTEIQLQDFASNLKIEDHGSLAKQKLIAAIAEALAPKQRALNVPKPHPLQVFEYFHQVIARACLINYQRKVPYQPVAVAYVDFEGTRQGGSVDPRQAQWPHLHALMFVRPDQQVFFEAQMKLLQSCYVRRERQAELTKLNALAKCRRLPREQHLRHVQLAVLLNDPTRHFVKGDLLAIRDIQYARYDRTKKPFDHVVGYSAKGLNSVACEYVRKGATVREAEWCGANDLYGVFPKQLFDRSNETTKPKNDIANP